MSELKDAEDRIQSHAYLWFHNTYPKFRGLLCYNHNNPKNKIDGNRQKALGLQAGRSDLVFYFNGISYMIEMKTPTGKQSEVQKKWQKQIESQGFKYVVCRSLESFQEIINEILVLPK